MNELNSELLKVFGLRENILDYDHMPGVGGVALRELDVRFLM